MKKFVRVVLIIALLPALYVVGVLIYATATDFDPPQHMDLATFGEGLTPVDSTITFLTWNIGYTGQGANADFFYDGGEQVHAPKEEVAAYREGIANFLATQNDVDVFMLQEIDSLARRSYYVDQVTYLTKYLPHHAYSFAINYKVRFVPVPFLNPLGRVISGVASYSRLPADDFERHAFDSQFEWPRRLFFLDRCFLSHRTPLDNGKELVVLNTHCSAYDQEGDMVAHEIERMVAFAEAEYKKGNYVVMGGDWNQCPPNYTPIDPDGQHNEHILSDDQLPEGWKWVADPTVPTNRKLDAPYSENTYTTVIDHFAVSPNVLVDYVRGVDLQFAYSDHQPVKMGIRLK